MKEETQSTVVRHALAFVTGFMAWAFVSSFVYLGLKEISPSEWLSNFIVFASYPLYHLIALRVVFSGETTIRQGKGSGIFTAIWIGGLLVSAAIMILIGAWRLVQRFEIGFLGGFALISLMFITSVAFALRKSKE